jgi:hypothetical protein
MMVVLFVGKCEFAQGVHVVGADGGQNVLEEFGAASDEEV